MKVLNPKTFQLTERFLDMCRGEDLKLTVSVQDVTFCFASLTKCRHPFQVLATLLLVTKAATLHLSFHFVQSVLERGLEPPHLAVYAPEAYVATNYTTPAIFPYSTTFIMFRYASGNPRVVR